MCIHKVTCMEMSTPSGPKHHMQCDCMRHWRLGNCHHIVAAMAKSYRFPQFNNLMALLEPMERRARPGPKRKRGRELRAKDPDSPGQVDTVDVYATAKRANVDTKGSRRKLLERIGAQTVRNYMREQRAAASSSASASSSGAGTGAGRGQGCATTAPTGGDQAPRKRTYSMRRGRHRPTGGRPCWGGTTTTGSSSSTHSKN